MVAQMLRMSDLLLIVGAAVMALLLVIVVRLRHRSHAKDVRQLAEEEVCEHLRPALELILSRGFRVTRVGQKARDFPLEIHVAPAPGDQSFDPKAVHDELKLAEPVFVSERNVLYCKEDWCEIDPNP